MNTQGRHLLVEYHGCDNSVLDDQDRIETLLVDAAVAAQATVVQSVFHRFAPQGVTGVVVVEESHLSIHTWPEAGYAAVDVFTCGECLPEAAHRVLYDGLGAGSAEVMLIDRGLGRSGHGISVSRHEREAGAETGRLAAVR